MIRCNIITIVTFLRYLRLLRESRQENHSSPKKSTLKFDLIRTASNLNFVMGWVLQQQKNNQQTYLTTSLPRDQIKKKIVFPNSKFIRRSCIWCWDFPKENYLLNSDVAIRPRMPAGPSTFTITRERISDQLYAICLPLPYLHTQASTLLRLCTVTNISSSNPFS